MICCWSGVSLLMDRVSSIGLPIRWLIGVLYKMAISISRSVEGVLSFVSQRDTVPGAILSFFATSACVYPCCSRNVFKISPRSNNLSPPLFVVIDGVYALVAWVFSAKRRRVKPSPFCRF